MSEMEKRPRWWPVAAMLAVVRIANAGDALRHGQPRAAMQALRPSIVCVCTGWTPCTAYYGKGYYTYCPTCGTYRAC